MEPDWPTLRRLREGFLKGSAGTADYWRSSADLAQYDATFAQRIGWKWDFVLEDLRRLGWQPPAGVVLDWGCGSGVANRAFVDHFGQTGVRELWLRDRSPLAAQFAAERAAAKYPGLSVQRGVPEQFDVLVVSHVLSELTPPQIEELTTLAQRATAVLWVEPGTYETSRALIAIRDRLRAGSGIQNDSGKAAPGSSSPALRATSPPLARGAGPAEEATGEPTSAISRIADGFHVVAPCPHQARCGVLVAGKESHWCHQFASPPEFVFTDAFWTTFSHTMEIDLRSLPLSYLVLDRRPVVILPAGTVRMLGRPEMFKPHFTLLGCTEAGLIEGNLTKREHPAEYRQFKKGLAPSLQCWECEETRIKSWKQFGAPIPGPA